jgi:hypothetical protein
MLGIGSLIAGAVLLASACASSSSGGGSRSTDHLAARPPTARERTQIARSVKAIWLYESRRPNTVDQFFRGLPRRPPLQPHIIKTRVVGTGLRYASAVVVLHDAAGHVHGTARLVLLRSGAQYVPGGWADFADPAVDFPLSCTGQTPPPLRALTCPSPWSAVGYPRPNVHEQTALSQPVPSADIHRIAWADVLLPGAVCGASHAIPPRRHAGGEAFVHADVNFPWVNPVVVSSWPKAVFGDLDGDGHDEAALGVGCANGGGTAAGQLRFSDAIFKVVGKRLQVVGILTARQPLDARATHTPIEGVTRIDQGRVVAREGWYGPLDGDCCPSGIVKTTWRYRNHRLVPARMRVIRPTWTSPVVVTDVLTEYGHRELVDEESGAVGVEPTRVRVTRGLRFAVWLDNYGTAMKRNVQVTVTIPQPNGAIIRTAMVHRIVPGALHSTIVHFDNLAAVRPGKTALVIRIRLPGASPLRYPVTFTG